MFEGNTAFAGHAAAATPTPAFIAGFASRHVAAADILARAFGAPDPFAATGVVPTPPRGFAGTSHGDGARGFHAGDTEPQEAPAPDPFIADPEPTIADALADARAAGYAEGYAAGDEAARIDTARDQALLVHLSDALGKATHVDRDAIAARLRHTVLTLVRQIVGEIGVSANHLTQRIDAAADLLADGCESAILRMHAADIALVEGKLPKAVFPIADPSIERGGFLLESASTIVEDSPSLWLEQLGAAIDRVPVPPSC